MATTSPSVLADIDVVSAAALLLQDLHAEVALFCIALCTHLVLFGNYKKLFASISGGKITLKHVEGAKVRGSSGSPRSLKNARFSPAGLQKTQKPPTMIAAAATKVAALVKSIEQQVKSDGTCGTIVKEMQSQLQGCSASLATDVLAGLLEETEKLKSQTLLAAVRCMISELSLPLNMRLGELLLRGYFSLRLFEEFSTLLAELEQALGSSAPGINMWAMKMALREGDVEAALSRFHALRHLWEDATPSGAPAILLQQLVRLASQKGVMPALLAELKQVCLTPESMEAVLTESAKLGESDAVAEVQQLGRAKGVSLTAGTFCSFIRDAAATDDVIAILGEVDGAPLAEAGRAEVLVASMDRASAWNSSPLAKAVLDRLPSKPAPAVAAALLRFHAGSDNSRLKAAEPNKLPKVADPNKLLKFYWKHFSAVDFSTELPVALLLVDCSLETGDAAAIDSLVRALPDSQQTVALLKALATNKRLDGAAAVFRAVGSSERKECHHNAMLDACVECGDVEAAEQIMADAERAGHVGVVTYNTLMKLHLRSGDLRRARRCLERMRKSGLVPTRVTFNELLDATLMHSPADAWSLMDEMQACGLKPNHITCSILLKNVQQKSRSQDVVRTLNIVDALEEEMDEVLLSSVVEACVRAGRGDLLVPRLRKQRAQRKVLVKGSHTYGSIIRAYSFVNDLDGVWEMWREMRTRHIAPTSITLGCMVEALCVNGDIDAAYDLIHEIRDEGEQSAAAVNAVVYCSVLKGFSHQKNFPRVWAVYQEMKSLGLKFSIVTYNTLIDSCARSGEMNRVPGLLSEMDTQNIEPTIITYSAIIKGYCNANRLEKAFEVYDSMKHTRFVPDEIMFNSLLDGCARQGLYDRGMAVIQEMERKGVKPSNFTLSVLVKLASRGKSLDEAFDQVKHLTTKYGFRPNVHVYNNLAHACGRHRNIPRAIGVLVSMLEERVRPDARSYSVVLRACAEVGERQEAVGLLRAALGLGGQVHPRLAHLPTKELQPQGGLPKDVIAEILGFIAGRPGAEDVIAVQLLRDLKQQLPGFKADPKLQLRLASRAGGPGGGGR
eukprot:gnl/TRDRNA2_/TRDRNA2_181041_c0_seq1.p1 gnl/TRDRNA2_/TRDRNA2_181041_c0~~gnl/TRDRNA2_/TRDRNA2_181041_c0_seq1.p1  ORF type:complete len:1068 (+),score=254.28 gnl/TRDRNA2_/TRDRNA2_181041_c0_seq1:109-3312(+)